MSRLIQGRMVAIFLCLLTLLLCGCGSEAKDLWGKRVILDEEPFPANKAGRCIGLSSDGKLLISEGGHLILQDLSTGAQIPLIVGDTLTEEMLRAKLMAQQDGRVTLDDVSEENLADACLPIASVSPNSCAGWLILDTRTDVFLLDTASGKLYGHPEARYIAACGNDLMFYRYKESCVHIYNRESGQTYVEDFSADFPAGDSSVCSAAFLADGSIAVIVRVQNRPELVIRSAQDEDERISLGRYNYFGWESIHSLGSRYLLIDDIVGMASPSLLVDRNSKDVSALVINRGMLQVLPQNDWASVDLDSILRDMESHVYWVQSLMDGKTMLLAGWGSRLLMFNPEQQETQIVQSDESGLYHAMSDGHERLFDGIGERLYRLRAE